MQNERPTCGKCGEVMTPEFIQKTERTEAELREQIEKGRQWNQLLELELANLRCLNEGMEVDAKPQPDAMDDMRQNPSRFLRRAAEICGMDKCEHCENELSGVEIDRGLTVCGQCRADIAESSDEATATVRLGGGGGALAGTDAPAAHKEHNADVSGPAPATPESKQSAAMNRSDSPAPLPGSSLLRVGSHPVSGAPTQDKLGLVGAGGVRPDWVHCIRHTHAEQRGRAWCGRSVSLEWVFQDIDHAVYTLQNKDRLQPCPECMAVIRARLTICAELAKQVRSSALLAAFDLWKHY